MEPEQAQKAGAALPAVSSTDWLGALKRHIADMHAREEAVRRKINDLRMEADTIQMERMELQNFISSTERT